MSIILVNVTNKAKLPSAAGKMYAWISAVKTPCDLLCEYGIDQYITTNGSDYVSLNITLTNRTWVTFQVRALSSATVGLTAEPANYTTNFLYELVLGVYGINVYYNQMK